MPPLNHINKMVVPEKYKNRAEELLGEYSTINNEDDYFNGLKRAIRIATKDLIKDNEKRSEIQNLNERIFKKLKSPSLNFNRLALTGGIIYTAMDNSDMEITQEEVAEKTATTSQSVRKHYKDITSKIDWLERTW